ncbi:hypothetical protein [Bradyrhizobium sp. BR 10289]|uniref:hypothetical protein n=1 Tax=Bradyrhizobium sp. BR 10289 TaxID=2749993 RepID=UPI001C64A227|nr:hypothetical protein [Bradyrhizobium sp. BR 10289]MBW7968142.1 hypothetical protein [Bradyrhizobium sp. BR 10289]
MTQYACARLMDRQPRFFQRFADSSAPLKLVSPVTTGQPDQAKTYDDRGVATVMCAVLNLNVALRTSSTANPWIVMEMPEEWL